jgi:hypothetical protein
MPLHTSQNVSRILLATVVFRVFSSDGLIASPQGIGGTFGWSVPQTLSTGASCHYHAVGDVNADGRPDIVAPTRSTSSLHLFINRGGGGFAPDATITTVGDVISVAITDLNHDGNQDLLAVGFASQMLGVHWGDGQGGFITGPHYPLPGNGHGVVIADFNGDGWSDVGITIIEGSDRGVVWWNDGNGGLIQGPTLLTDVDPYYIQAADFDGDGDPDIEIASFTTSRMVIYENQQSAGFFYSGPVQLQGVNPGRTTFADFDGDGLMEFITPYRSSPSISHYESSGGTSFNYLGNTTVPAAGAFTGWWSETADFDMDGHLDVVFGGCATDTVGIALQAGPGIFLPTQQLNAGSNVNCLRIADFNGDGSPDISAAAHDSGAIEVLYNTLFSDCNGDGIADSVDISSSVSMDCNGNGVPDECDITSSSPSLDCDADGVVDSCEIAGNGSLDLNGNGTLDRCEQVGLPYCFGDGTGSACPCDPGQAGNGGGGCAHSHGGGARLFATGNAQVSADSVTLRATDLPPNSVGLFFQGTLVQGFGSGSAFGDGLLCVNHNIIRLQVRQSIGVLCTFGNEVATDPSVSSAGVIPSAGGVRYYQLWFRDAMPFCTTSTFNLTNGLEIHWLQ